MMHNPTARSRANYLDWYRGRAQVIGTTDPLDTLHPYALTSALNRLKLAHQEALSSGSDVRTVNRIDGWIETVRAELMGRTA